MQDPINPNDELARRLEANENLAAQPNGAGRPGNINLVTQANFDGVKVEQTDGLECLVYGADGSVVKTTVAKAILQQSFDDVSDDNVDLYKANISFIIKINELKAELKDFTYTPSTDWDFNTSLVFPTPVVIKRDDHCNTIYTEASASGDGSTKRFVPAEGPNNELWYFDNGVVALNGQVVGAQDADQDYFEFEQAPLENSIISTFGHGCDYKYLLDSYENNKSEIEADCENFTKLFEAKKAAVQSNVAALKNEESTNVADRDRVKAEIDAKSKERDDKRKKMEELYESLDIAGGDALYAEILTLLGEIDTLMLENGQLAADGMGITTDIATATSFLEELEKAKMLFSELCAEAQNDVNANIAEIKESIQKYNDMINGAIRA